MATRDMTMTFLLNFHLKQALIGTGFSVNRDTQTLDKTVDGLRKMLENCREVRRAGSAALDMYVLIIILCQGAEIEHNLLLLQVLCR
jgi:fructose-1,6-bisphosphatase/inositol monophosphatase family enzyme